MALMAVVQEINGKVEPFLRLGDSWWSAGTSRQDTAKQWAADVIEEAANALGYDYNDVDIEWNAP